MTLKKFVGKLHLWLGLSSGAIILFLGITGCMLAFQKEIETVNAKRESFIATEKKKNATKNNDQTLESEIEKIIRNQAQRFNMVIQ